MSKVCVFFGHRFVADPEVLEPQLKRVVRALINEGVDTFWLGGYGDFDKLAERVTKELKVEFPHIQRVLALAYLPTNKEDYQYKNAFYDLMFYPEGVEEAPKKFAITKRNRYMVENADVVVAWVNAETGGAALAIQHAQKLKKKVILLNPKKS